MTATTHTQHEYVFAGHTDSICRCTTINIIKFCYKHPTNHEIRRNLLYLHTYGRDVRVCISWTAQWTEKHLRNWSNLYLVVIVCATGLRCLRIEFRAINSITLIGKTKKHWPAAMMTAAAVAASRPALMLHKSIELRERTWIADSRGAFEAFLLPQMFWSVCDVDVNMCISQFVYLWIGARYISLRNDVRRAN